MAQLFSEAWMQSFMSAWNSEPELAAALEKIGFNSVIGYGVDGEAQPRGYLDVRNGRAVAAGAFTGQTMNWDLRASEGQWLQWFKDPPGMMGLGMAYTTRKIKFVVGDYGAMIKDPRMAGPFIKSFAVMGRAG